MKESGDNNKITLEKDTKEKSNTHVKDDPKKNKSSSGKGKDTIKDNNSKNQKEKLGLPTILMGKDLPNTKPPLGHVLSHTSAAGSPLGLNKEIEVQETLSNVNQVPADIPSSSSNTPDIRSKVPNQNQPLLDMSSGYQFPPQTQPPLPRQPYPASPPLPRGPEIWPQAMQSYQMPFQMPFMQPQMAYMDPFYMSPPPQYGGYRPNVQRQRQRPVPYTQYQEDEEEEEEFEEESEVAEDCQQSPEPTTPQEEAVEDQALPLPSSLMDSPIKTSNISSDLAEALGQALYASTDEKRKELLKRCVELAGLPTNVLNPVPKTETKWALFLSPEAKGIDRRLTKTQEDLWSAAQPMLRALESMRLSKAEGSAEIVEHLHLASLGICSTIGELTKQRRDNIEHHTKSKVDMRLLKDVVYPAGKETLFGDMLTPTFVHFPKVPLPGKGKK